MTGHPPHAYAVSVTELDVRPCDFCGADIMRGTTNRGRASWFDAQPDITGGRVNHWITCPERKAARQKYGKRPKKGLAT